MRDKLLMATGHYSIYILWVAVIVNFADLIVYGNTNTLAGYITAAPWVVWWGSYFADRGYHQERLCEKCIAGTPLDTQAAVTRWRWALKTHHMPWVVLIVLLTALALEFTGNSFKHTPTWAIFADAGVVLAIGVDNIMTWQHRRLYPWCPYCHWDDGGDHEVAPDVPATPATR